MINPLVSLCIITYNQKQYIKECINGALLQNLRFNFEIIINDDNSTDGTSVICNQFLNENSEIVSYYRNEQNLGMVRNWIASLNRCKGKYIAMCEGDDYWTDPNKLQRQVDFLEANPDYNVCFHRVYYKMDGREGLVLSQLNTSEKEETYSIKDLANENIIHTPSVVYRNGLIKEFPSWFNTSPVGDYVLHLLNAKKGLIKYFPQAMAVYRIHGSGIWSTKNIGDTHPKWLNLLDKLIREDFEEQTIVNFLKQKDRRLNEYISWLLVEKKYDLIKQVVDKNYTKKETHSVQMLLDTFINHISDLDDHIERIKKSRSYLLASKLSKLKNNWVKDFFKNIKK